MPPFGKGFLADDVFPMGVSLVSVGSRVQEPANEHDAQEIDL